MGTEQEVKVHHSVVRNALMCIDSDLSLSLNDFAILDKSNLEAVMGVLIAMEKTWVYHVSGRLIICDQDVERVSKANPFEPWNRTDFIEYVYYSPDYKSGRITVKHMEPFMDYLRVHNPNNPVSPFGFITETTYVRLLKDCDHGKGLAGFTIYDHRKNRDVDGDYVLKFMGWKPTDQN